MRHALAGIAVALLVVLAACGDKGSGGGGGGGGGGLVGGGGGGGVVGTWVLDVAKSVEAAEAAFKKGLAEMPAEQRAFAEQMMAGIRKGMEGMKMEVTFNSDKTFSAAMPTPAMPGQTSKSEAVVGTWSQSGDRVTVTAKTVDGNNAEGEDAKAMNLVLKGNTLTMEGNDGEEAPPAVLKRK